jgi:glyoxylase-like metal-dependent hydrolase (beta-lactamase superfamily II)
VSLSPVHRISIPTPYAVGPVNCYVIDVQPVTLIDAGVNTPEGHNALVLGLAECGHSLHSIERVFITHAHPDHYGLVHVVQEASGAAVHFPAREIARVRDRQMLFEVGRLLVEAGTPLDLLFQMDQQRKKDRTRPAMNHDEVALVEDGDRFEFDGFDLEARFMPGHTGGHVVYYERGAARCGPAISFFPTCPRTRCSSRLSTNPESGAARSGSTSTRWQEWRQWIWRSCIRATATPSPILRG